ncbi:PTS glucose transporter subunit IIA [Lacticaseibacillus paracasei]|uniref:PTS glucose transporter subunit IIA n=1 Tax=Lacticaseibacillus paracasei TaxID=1597 RepID=UPI002ADED0A8|nr:PTS glucose transporter subunit IIA [Lacticaseibacillus paracasei]MEA0974151.1 PTS glucose transporter subunit IIA [Lacticaseibacillus paracasei]
MIQDALSLSKLCTRTLKGEPFNIKVKAGDHVTQGQRLGTADFAAITKAGYDPTVIVAIMNTSALAKVDVDLNNKIGDLMSLAI